MALRRGVGLRPRVKDRDAMRELNRMVEHLERGESEKYILTKNGQMRAVVVSVDYFADLRRTVQERGLETAA
jgi:hypothetical protein